MSRMSKAQIKRLKEIIEVEERGNYTDFKGISEASKELGIPSDQIAKFVIRNF